MPANSANTWGSRVRCPNPNPLAANVLAFLEPVFVFDLAVLNLENTQPHSHKPLIEFELQYMFEGIDGMARVMFIVQEELGCLHCINLRIRSTFTSRGANSDSREVDAQDKIKRDRPIM